MVWCGAVVVVVLLLRACRGGGGVCVVCVCGGVGGLFKSEEHFGNHSGTQSMNR